MGRTIFNPGVAPTQILAVGFQWFLVKILVASTVIDVKLVMSTVE